MANLIELEDTGERLKDAGETVVELLVDLDILCRKLELLGQETLIFCSGSDGVITSTVASLFFKQVDTVFAKFKEFCTQRPTVDQLVVPPKPDTDSASKHEPVEDEYDGDTDDEVGDFDKSENTAEETRDETGLNSETLVTETSDVQETVDSNTEVQTSNKRYLENGRLGNGIKKTKLDGTDFFSDKKNLLPSVSVRRIDEKNGPGNHSQKDKKYLEVNDEKLLLLTPEESGLDLTQDENTPFSCFKCEKIAGGLSRLREHLTKVHKIKIGHQCVCGRFFQDTASYNKHTDNKWYNMYHHECQHCKGIYPSVNALKSHMMRVHDENSADIIVSQAEKLGDFPCLKCETLFHHEQHLIDHNDNLPDCDVAVKDDKMVEKDLADSEIVYMIEDGKDVKTTYGKIMASQKSAPYTCPCCTDSFTRKSNFQRHMLRHLSQGTHLCLICGNKFKGKDGLQRHLNQHMTRPYNCSNCRNRFETQAELSLHMSSRCKEGSRDDFKCDLCDHVAPNMSSLRVHKNMHAGLKPHECAKCEKSFATKSSLERHDAVRHQEATPFKCGQCGKAFKTKDNLKKHSKVHQEPKFSCEVCGKGWVEKCSLRKHMQVHTKAKPFICELCGKAYGRKSLLDNHRRLHTGEKPYKCTKEGCDKAFRSYSNLKQHIRNHSATHPYVCDVCGKMFKQPGRLNHHRKDHTVEFRWPCAYCEQKFKSIFMYKGHLAKFHADMKNDIEEKTNIRLYECEMCHKMYGDKDDLTRHIYIHQNIKPFSCQYCGKSFNDKSNMRQHEKIHTGVKHHWCEVCKKGFIHKRDLRNHMQTNHTKDEDDDVKTPRERKPRKKPLLNMNSMASQGSYAEFTPVQGQEMDMQLIQVDYQGKKGVETVIEEQPRDLTVQPALAYLGSHGEIPMHNFPVAAVNAATGQIEPLMIIENYQ
ncbi:zinc finger protein 676-like isoform X2 [Mercenaria mercenaria]|uniref:zinc finger protein 676-like isoform X2 n=1 Tax=Mercenaria mercenaria TaxID=6596 RepID=UPI00234E952B|nr:zinc finger protein 676-like isoform X2 [Mercenaria mercenaria]